MSRADEWNDFIQKIDESTPSEKGVDSSILGWNQRKKLSEAQLNSVWFERWKRNQIELQKGKEMEKLKLLFGGRN